MSPRFAVPLLVVLSVVGCAETPRSSDAGGDGASAAAPTRPDGLPEGAEALSFLGDTLYAPALPEEVASDRMTLYAEAEDALAAAPEDADALIWMGRRTAYLGRYRDAIDIYTFAMSVHPEDARLYRHRGHRYVTVREPDAAIADLRRAAELTEGRPDEVEPDGLPNDRGIPTSTLQFNIWYHLGLAHYLTGDFEAAAEAYARCAEVSVHPDSQVATAYWRVMTLRRLGREDEARAVLAGITSDMDVIESGGYLDLLLLHKGERTAEDLVGPGGPDATLASTTAGYGVGAWYLLEGNEEEALRLFQRTVSGRDQWAAFGYLAAEAELARLGEGER
jgi:tetratricopeptide (TPR) repeat protein